MPQDNGSRALARYRLFGLLAVAIGSVTAVAGALLAHFTGLPPVDSIGQDLYPSIPRGWVFESIGQIIALTGGLLILAGITLAFLYQREMTWARASIGAFVFTTLMMILFGILPNEWLTLAQSDLEWTPQRVVFTIPPGLVRGSEIDISLAAVKDMISGGYAVGAVGAVAVAMYQWQERTRRRAAAPPPQPVSRYGRPLTKVEG
ncbi:MAG: hypothetical protein M3349_02930 [Actinomycetota bacterium]|nr:hypothetical protein [Actinomycetota bacterium]